MVLAPYPKSVIVGLLLSDGWLSRASATNKNCRLGFAQSGAHSKYFWFVFFSLAHYCSSYPIVRDRTRLGKQNISLQFFTRSLTCITELYFLFYPKGVKIVPEDIYNMLTPVALAHMIMGDGGVQRHGLQLCTDSFTISDVVRLINVLILRYTLDCTLQMDRQYPRIYIKQVSIPLLRSIVISHMHPSMYYKLGLKN